MLTVRQKKKIDVADGVTVTIRGMTAAEQAVFADAATTVDANGKRDESAVVRAGLVGVCGGEGFAIEKPTATRWRRLLMLTSRANGCGRMRR